MPGWQGPRPVDRSFRSRPWTIGDPAFCSDRFDRPRRSSPWAGHRWFAYDLVGWLRPSRIVELGTHFGCSFFALCQATQEHGTDSELIAVDTWAGDPHAGFYGDEVYQQVATNLAEHFAGVRATLSRKLFDEALEDVEDSSIDLLHIDGYHTYEAVTHDFRSWEPKLSASGTVLFHDINPSSGYGSSEFWRQLAAERGGFAFWHNFGLGVWTRHAELASVLASEQFAVIARFYPTQARADLMSMSVEDITALVDAKQQIVEQQQRHIDDRDETIAAQADLIDAKQRIIDHQTILVDDRDEAIAAQAALIDAKQRIIEGGEALVAERDAAVKQLTRELAAKQAAFDEQAELLAARRPLLRRR
jgi:hypothetical protein